MANNNFTYNNLGIGIDIGSTTAKIVVSDGGNILYSRYERHFSRAREKTAELLRDALDALPYLGKNAFRAAISGSAGLGIATETGIPFVQEVFATGEIVKSLEPDTSVVIELGGEDAKVIFFRGGADERMNGSCAGGTGAFIDQMATLLDMSADELDAASLNATRLYPIASRCGVFAKTDIQPLLNQGAAKADIAASIYRAVVNQTVAGLAQGRKIEGKVMFLGGPLYFCAGLRKAFTDILGLSPEDAVFPEYARFSVAMGAAIYAEKTDKLFSVAELIAAMERAPSNAHSNRLPPLFSSDAKYNAFCSRHWSESVPFIAPENYSGDAYLGIDCGSTTTKLALITENGEFLYTYYNSNRGNPVNVVAEQLKIIYDLCGEHIKIISSAVTGYGEELIKNAFGVDLGLVETIAHYTAARHFNPAVDFILDIGGQDIKCFKIKNGVIDSIMLNEACSSGCGSFIETFARAMGHSAEEFSRLGLTAKAPVDLGSRCTVFMNSSVKQAQKEGATVGDISAGLSISVVKNAIYKVIRAKGADELGDNVVVQGGTFLNDAVLRAFETELRKNVIRPSIAGLMGAYGAALRAMENAPSESSLLTPDELAIFTHSSRSAVCRGCENNCSLTVNSFGRGKTFISGNRCEKGAGIVSSASKFANIHAYKREYFMSLPKNPTATRGTIGIPLALGMYELLPFWHKLWLSLGFNVETSGMSTRATYEKGQFTIPSDTACYPAKIMHGHIETLLDRAKGHTDYSIFYPALTYNVDEGASDNHYNCPVVAYYSELLAGNVEGLREVKFLYPYLNINDDKELTKELFLYLNKQFGGKYRFDKREIRAAIADARAAQAEYMDSLRRLGEATLADARRAGVRVLVLAGRPYHVDSEIGHGIYELAASLGFAVVTEDSVCHLAAPERTSVLNQWTYHARLYRAAKFTAENPDVELVQLVSFGCGLDAVTTDEVRDILERHGKLYTGIKIDEITNLGAVKIRLRSLIGALDERKSNGGKTDGDRRTPTKSAPKPDRKEEIVNV